MDGMTPPPNRSVPGYPGQQTGIPDPFGYRNVVVNGADGKRSHVKREINDVEAQVVRRIFQDCATGSGLKRIAKTLNAEKQPAPRPKANRPRGWTPSTVRAILHRELFRGIQVWNRRRSTDAWGKRSVERRPETEWIKIEVPDLRIVSDDQWEAAHARLRSAASVYLGSTGGRRFGKPIVGLTCLVGIHDLRAVRCINDCPIVQTRSAVLLRMHLLRPPWDRHLLQWHTTADGTRARFGFGMPSRSDTRPRDGRRCHRRREG